MVSARNKFREGIRFPPETNLGKGFKKSFLGVYKGVLMTKLNPNPQFYADLNESVHFE
jgi:hypothetical protein